jgi:hypothetical protein
MHYQVTLPSVKATWTYAQRNCISFLGHRSRANMGTIMIVLIFDERFSLRERLKRLIYIRRKTNPYISVSTP